VSLAVLLLAVLWGLHESSALKPGRGVEVPSSLYGTNAIITGSTSGLGFEAALQMYELGAHVVVHSSSQKRADKSAAAIRELARNWGGKATPLAADLGDFDEVVAFSKKLPTVMPRVHLFFINAAMLYGVGPHYAGKDDIMSKPDAAFQSKSGHDSCMAINHLGHYLMTLLLLPQLAPKATVVIVSSSGAWSSSLRRLMPPWGMLGSHRFDKKTSTPKRIKWEQGGLKRHANMAYKDSKLANVCFARWLRRQLGENYTVVLHDPGLVTTAPSLDRESRVYQERLYRKARSEVYYRWHAPTEEGGTHLMQSAFITQRPVPDWVVSYFVPDPVVHWYNSYTSAESGRRGNVARFSAYQKLTWGLHGTVGPECDEDTQDRFMAWSAMAIGAKRPFPANFR